MFYQNSVRSYLHLGSESDLSSLIWNGLLVCRCTSDTQEESGLVLLALKFAEDPPYER